MRENLFWILALSFALLVSACSSSPKLPEDTQTGGSDVLLDRYTIAVGDSVKVDVWNNPELSVTVPVRPDGRITVPLVGDVMAAGKEPEAVARDIKERLKAYVKNPTVTVILTGLQGYEFLSRIRVTGAVEQGVSIPYQKGMTVLDAVLEAGGPNDFAAPNRTRLHRRTAKGTESYDIYLDDIMNDGDMTTNLLLKPGDAITVPERYF